MVGTHRAWRMHCAGTGIAYACIVPALSDALSIGYGAGRIGALGANVRIPDNPTTTTMAQRLHVSAFRTQSTFHAMLSARFHARPKMAEERTRRIVSRLSDAFSAGCAGARGTRP